MRHFLTILFLSCLPAFSATVCIGPASTGSGTGADYSNLKQWSSGTPARGETWYLVDGTYAGKTINPAQSGTTLFTIKKATVADHGGVSTGWVDTMGDGQATFTGQVWLNTSWLTFDGVSHGATNWSQVAADYGFTSSGLNSILEVANLSIVISNITIANYSGVAVGGDVEKLFIETDNSTKSVHNVTISHMLVDGFQNAYWATSAGTLMDNWVFEYNMCKNGFGSSANHGEWINNNFGLMTNQVVRFNWFKGPTSGFTGVIVANNNDIKAPQIYGNIFDGYDSGNGVITGTSGGTIFNAQIYNNTFLNCGVGMLGNVAGSACVFTNNLVYNMDAGIQTGFAHDYNYYVSTTSTPTEPNRQTASGNPFVNSASGNFALTVNSTAGQTLASPFNVDQYGTTRATWTRGAIEFGDVTAPTLSSATIPSAGNVINLVFSETVSIGAGGNGGLALTMSGGGAETLTYSSGSGSTTLVYSLSRTVLSGETKSSGLDYTQPGDGIEDGSGNDLVTFTSAAVTNNSTQTGGGGRTNSVTTAGLVSTGGKVSIGQ